MSPVRLATITLLALVSAGACSSPFGPGKVDPEWPNPDRDGEKPVPINQTVTIENSEGTVIILIEKMTPRENGTAKVGQLGQIWTRITNNSDQWLATANLGISDGPEDNPGQAGRQSSLFYPHGVRFWAPGESRNEIFGTTVSQSEIIPYLRLWGKYAPSKDDRIFKNLGPWTEPDWTHDVHLNWNLTH